MSTETTSFNDRYMSCSVPIIEELGFSCIKEFEYQKIISINDFLHNRLHKYIKEFGGSKEIKIKIFPFSPTHKYYGSMPIRISVIFDRTISGVISCFLFSTEKELKDLLNLIVILLNAEIALTLTKTKRIGIHQYMEIIHPGMVKSKFISSYIAVANNYDILNLTFYTVRFGYNQIFNINNLNEFFDMCSEE